MYLDLTRDEHDWRQIYKHSIGFVAPRPIALVSTVSPTGVTNLAPFSWYNMVSANPLIVMVCPSIRRDGVEKDTLQNLRASGEFAIATVTEEILDPMVRCGSVLPSDQSEFDFSGLTPTPARLIKAPLVKESPVNIECRLREVISFGDTPGSGNAVFGDVVALHIDDDLLAADGLIDTAKLRAVGRLGRQHYTVVREHLAADIPPPPGPTTA